MKPCGHSQAVDGCRVCYLFDHDPRYRAHWGGEPLPANIESIPLTVRCKCGHRFEAKTNTAGMRVKCPACRKLVGVPGVRIKKAKPKQKPARIELPQTTPLTLTPPGSLRRTWNFARAVASLIWSALRGKAEVPVSEQEARLITCVQCDLFDRRTLICTHKDCGCNVMKKRRWAGQTCPLSKW